jgi:signal transduction histidine kinase
LEAFRRLLSATPVRLAAAIVLMGVIFVADTLTNLEIAVAVFYVTVVLVAVGSTNRRNVIALASACALLTIASYFLSPSGRPQTGIVNGLISIGAVALTTYLVLEIEEARTAVEEARSRLDRAARVTALGELSASIAHEINQPLAAIVTNGSACLRWLTAQSPNVDEARRVLGQIVEDGTRAADVITRVRRLARGASTPKELVDLNRVIVETLSLVRAECAKHGIGVTMRLQEGLPTAWADPVQLQQVIVNLVVNAIEANRSVMDGPRNLAISTRLHDADEILVEVRDSGPGIREPDRTRAFDAFYTTKQSGMGMGLAISRSIVEAHGGKIWIAPNRQTGVAVQFTIPVSSRSE